MIQPEGVILDDPDDWIPWWANLHPSQRAHNDLAIFLSAVGKRVSRAEEGIIAGAVPVREVEGGPASLIVNLSFSVTRDADGTTIHIAGIRSEGDPLRPVYDM